MKEILMPPEVTEILQVEVLLKCHGHKELHNRKDVTHQTHIIVSSLLIDMLYKAEIWISTETF